MLKKKQVFIPFTIILLFAAGFRLYGLKWDDTLTGYPHPDERHLANTMARISLHPGGAKDAPVDWRLLNDPGYSPLNPRRLIPGQEQEHYDLAYGTLPVYLYRFAAVMLAELTGKTELDSYRFYGMIGRSITVVFSLLSVYWVFLIGKRTFDECTALLAAAFVATCVLHIQLSHFMTVDLLMSAFMTVGLLACVRFAQSAHMGDAVMMGLALGLSMACKFNGITLGAGIAASYIIAGLAGKRRLIELLAYCVPLTLLWWALAFGAFEYFALRDPYTYIHAIGVQAKMVSGETDWPYTRQYINTAPYLFQLENLVLWGMGGGLGGAAILGIVWSILDHVAALVLRRNEKHPIKRTKGWIARWLNHPGRAGVLVLLGWALPFFAYTARLEVKFLRYMLPLTPVLCLFAADILIRLGGFLHARWRHLAKKHAPTRGPGVFAALLVRWALPMIVLLAALAWSVAYMRVYAQEHPWQAASRWFYANAPKGSVYTWEAWGDPLPVDLPAFELYRQNYGYRDVWMHPYHDFSPVEGLEHLANSLREADYVILSTPRIYLSVTRLPWRYPVIIRYYELLFAEQLGFKLEAKFTAYPGFGQIEINDLKADQSFFDYEHPLVLIFGKTRDLTALEWQTLFTEQLQVTPRTTREGDEPPVKLAIPY